MFGDRRKRVDRRHQKLPMPAGLDRRSDCRRSRSFKSQPWWLQVDYATELVVEAKPATVDASSSTTPKTKPPATKG